MAVVGACVQAVNKRSSNPVPTLRTLAPPAMSTSRAQEDTYEAQNDQRLDELHSKIRTLRGVGPARR